MTAFTGLGKFLAGYTLRPHFANDLRLFRLLYCMERTRHLTAPIAELGVGSGYSLVYILTALRDNKDPRAYFGFDTFEGFPYIHGADLEGLPEDRKKVSVVGRYAEFDFAHISKLVRRFGMAGRAQLVKGRFEETLPQLDPSVRFSFVFLDCDLHQSYQTCLSHLYERTVDSGVILFDEYEHTRDWPGARKAIDSFFEGKPEKPEPLPFGTSWIVVKGRAAGRV